jgi:hypothetical protein
MNDRRIAPAICIETQALPARADKRNASGGGDKHAAGAGSLTIVNDAKLFRQTMSQVEQKAIELPSGSTGVNVAGA